MDFQFLGIPPKGEPWETTPVIRTVTPGFQFLGIPPKGEPVRQGSGALRDRRGWFPISRDPPEGGTATQVVATLLGLLQFPISRDPPEGGTYQN